MTRFHLSLISLFFLFSACKKNVPSHVMTQVDGLVTDPFTDKPLEGMPIHISGSHYSFMGLSWHDLPNVDTSDANGRFSIRFPSDGRSKSFRVQARTPSDIYGYGVIPTAELQTGRYNQVTLAVKYARVLRLNLRVQQNPYDTLYVQNYAGYKDTVLGRTIDTTFLLLYSPDGSPYSYNVIVTDRIAGRNRYQAVNYAIPKPPPDTLTVDVTIDNAANLPFQP